MKLYLATDIEAMEMVSQRTEDSLETDVDRKKEMFEMAVRERPAQKVATFIQQLESVILKLKNVGMKYEAASIDTMDMTWEQFKDKLFHLRLMERCRVKTKHFSLPG